MTPSAPQTGGHLPFEGNRPSAATLTVSQLTALVKEALHERFPAPVHITGEISNFKAHSSGHLYFTMKDPGSELSCVMWRSRAARLKFTPRDGMEIVAAGEIDLFERTGRYQLYVQSIEPRGTGAFELAFRERYEKLHSEGLFDDCHKQELPRIPAHIAIVTSPTGAAVRDIFQTIRRRFPGVTLSLYPVLVQGPQAAPDIAAALDNLNMHAAQLGIDVLIVGRGGGSLEDLWAFNEEVLARAIFRCQVPVISAVGHETDVTISDLVADVRAATPTAAAELAVPDRTELLDDLAHRAQRLRRTMQHRLDVCRHSVNALAAREPLRAPQRVVQRRSEHLDHLATRLEHAAISDRLRRSRRIAQLAAALRILEPTRRLATAQRQLLALTHRAAAGVRRKSVAHERRLHAATSRLFQQSPLTVMSALQQRLTARRKQLLVGLSQRLRHDRDRLHALNRHLHAVGYRQTLARGYSVTRAVRSGKLITTAQQVRAGDVVRTESADGEFESTVNPKSASQMELF